MFKPVSSVMKSAQKMLGLGARFNNNKSASCRILKGEVVKQAELFEQFSDADHQGFLEDISFQIIDRVFENSRQREGFWQFKIDSFIAEGLNTRFIDLLLLVPFFVVLFMALYFLLFLHLFFLFSLFIQSTVSLIYRNLFTVSCAHVLYCLFPWISLCSLGNVLTTYCCQ